MKYSKYWKPLGVLCLSIVVVFWILGDKIFHLDEYMFATYYDVMKNYYTSTYYVLVQEGVFLHFDGMNYPNGEHILYTDNTPLLAMFQKALGIRRPVGFFNAFILLNYILSPIIGFKIGDKLGFKLWLSIVFAFFVTYLSPQIFYITAASNLALSFIPLLGFYLLMSLKESARNHWNYLGLIFLIVLSSGIHLYYLILLAFIFLPGGLILLFQNRKKGLWTIGATLLAVIIVYLSIYITDTQFSYRPKGNLGFNYDRWRSFLDNYFQSYEYLSIPSMLDQKSTNTDWHVFIGSAYPLVIMIGLVMAYLNKAELNISRVKSSVILILLVVTLLSVFTSIGNQIIIGPLKTSNIFNPLYIASKFTDTFNNFRFLSRFRFIAFIGASIMMFWVMNKGLRNNKVKYLAIVAVLFFAVDSLQSIQYFKGFVLNSDNIFSENNTSYRDTPQWQDETYDAILPIPYFAVGNEAHGYIIDDNDAWSRKVYQLSIKNKTPLLATKLSRTPLKYTKAYFSLFMGEDVDKDLLQSLLGKKILIAISKEYKANVPRDEPAKTLAEQPNLFLDKWAPTFLKTEDNIDFYEIQF